MPNMADILLKKDDGTSVTFNPVDDKDGVSTWRTRISGVSNAGQCKVTMQYETMKSGKMRVNAKLTVPIMEVIPAGSVNASGIQAAPAVADDESASVTFYLSPRGSNETRADMMRMFAHLVSGGGVVAAQTCSPENATADTFRDAAEGKVLPYGISNLLIPN